MAALMLVPASSASAALTGEYAKFSKCPLSNPAVEGCIYADTTSGTFTTGKKTVPLINPVLLQGGLEGDFENISQPFKLIGVTSGNALSKTPQPVPGGLLGVTAPTWWPKFLQDLFNETINNGFTGVTATVEIAGPNSGVQVNLLKALEQSGTAFTFPVKVKLDNPFLGSNCYIGSNSSPILIQLTTGTTSPPPPNKPITGAPGEPGSPANGIISLKANRLVNNSFAAPGANGCGGLFSFLIDPFVNSIVGIPSAAGTNTAILEGTTYIADAQILRELP
ncbi:MAG TPA: hypothetical protein VF255_05250 [Solirubrobacterales bacterium]